MWPKGPENITTVTDRLFEGVMRPVGKSYMMGELRNNPSRELKLTFLFLGISPWFYTNLPQWNKAWVWRGDNVWYQRWQQVKITIIAHYSVKADSSRRQWTSCRISSRS